MLLGKNPRCMPSFAGRALDSFAVVVENRPVVVASTAAVAAVVGQLVAG